jgi:hypothetical protein
MTPDMFRDPNLAFVGRGRARLPPGSVPLGARFDPISPFGPFQGDTDPDEFPPPL